jgi:hypothetical protein
MKEKLVEIEIEESDCLGRIKDQTWIISQKNVQKTKHSNIFFEKSLVF